MKIVITGPTGAIGVALIQKCIQNQISVLAICHPGSARIKNIPESRLVKVIEADLGEFDQLAVEQNERYEVFYHLGWKGTTGEARNEMPLQVDNIRYTLAAVRLAERLGCHTFVGAGSQAEYGRVEGILRPDTPVFPETGYGMAKLCAGQMSGYICEKSGIKHIWARILSVYGPCDGVNSMISTSVRNMIEGKRTDYTPAEQRWDYLYSADAAEALYLLGQKGKSGKVYIVGRGESRALRSYILEMAEIVEKVCSVKVSLGIGALPYQEKQVMHLEADITELNRDTGFTPRTTFEEGIREILRKEGCGQ